jgi:hypothetical protein
MTVKGGLVFATSAFVLLVAAARAGDEPETTRRTLATPTRETLKAGARCVIEMQEQSDKRGVTKMVYEGVITQINDHEDIGLAVERRDRKIVGKRPLMIGTPVLDRWLGRNVGVGYSTPDAEVGDVAFLPSGEIRSLKIVVEQPTPRTAPAPVDSSMLPVRGRD